MAHPSTREVRCRCPKTRRQPSDHPLKRSFNIIKLNWKQLLTRKWILFLMKCAHNSRPRPMATLFRNLSCFSRQGWWKSKCKCWSLIRRAWMMLLIMSSILMPPAQAPRQTWDSRFFMKIAPCYYRWWHRWLSNSMKWKFYMKILKLHQLMLAQKSMNSRKFCQCKETCIWDPKVDLMANRSMETWILWIQT